MAEKTCVEALARIAFSLCLPLSVDNEDDEATVTYPLATVRAILEDIEPILSAYYDTDKEHDD